MISSDTPVLLSKACEILIKELTLRACLKMEEVNRRTLLRVDIARAISQEENFDFLAEIIPVNENKVFFPFFSFSTLQHFSARKLSVHMEHLMLQNYTRMQLIKFAFFFFFFFLGW